VIGAGLSQAGNHGVGQPGEHTALDHGGLGGFGGHVDELQRPAERGAEDLNLVGCAEQAGPRQG